QHVGIRLETVGKLVEGELLEDSGVAHVRLRLELLGRLVVLFLLPVHRDLGFTDLGEFLLFNFLRHLISLLADTTPSRSRRRLCKSYASPAARPELQNGHAAI